VSEKTEIGRERWLFEADYPSRAIGAFSGDVWHVSLQWQPRERNANSVLGWRELEAYLTATPNYYVSNGVSIAPVWAPSREDQRLSSGFSEKQNYIGSIIGSTGPHRVMIE